MALKYTDNASTTLDGNILIGATSLTVAVGDGDKFPTLVAGDWFYFTIIDSGDSNNFEICKCAERSGDTFSSITRGIGGINQAWTTGALVQLRVCKNMVEDLMDHGLDGGRADTVYTSQQIYDGGSAAD